MELQNTSLCYAFPYQKIKFDIRKKIKEISAHQSTVRTALKTAFLKFSFGFICQAQAVTFFLK